MAEFARQLESPVPPLRVGARPFGAFGTGAPQTPRPRCLTAAAVLPEYVRCCSHNPAPPKTYAFWAWKKAAPAKRLRVPYHCNSWRCTHCAPHAASVLFARIKEAFAPYRAEDCLFAVLTLDSPEHFRGKTDLAAVYREFGKRLASLQGRWKYYLESQGLSHWGSEWVATVEAHRSGVPHVNLVLHCPDLAKHVAKDYAARRDNGETHRQATLLRGTFLDAALKCGFGPQSTIDVAASKDALAGYIAKTAKRADNIHKNVTRWTNAKTDSVTGEVVKLSQLPVQAPKNFRRVRSGIGFLPKKRKDEAWTGTVVRRFVDGIGHHQVESLVRSKCSVLADQIQEVCHAESAMLFEELKAAASLTRERRLLHGAMGVPIKTRGRVHSVRIQETNRKCDYVYPTRPTTAAIANGAAKPAAQSSTPGNGSLTPPTAARSAWPNPLAGTQQRGKSNSS